jgi:hypothetical protein
MDCKLACNLSRLDFSALLRLRYIMIIVLRAKKLSWYNSIFLSKLCKRKSYISNSYAERVFQRGEFNLYKLGADPRARILLNSLVPLLHNSKAVAELAEGNVDRRLQGHSSMKDLEPKLALIAPPLSSFLCISKGIIRIGFLDNGQRNPVS